MLFTDYASLDLYFFDDQIIGKIISLAAVRPDIKPADVSSRLTPVLLDLFAMRQANLSLGLGLEWLSFDRCCSFGEGDIHFDRDDFVRRYLNRGGKLRSFDEFTGAMARYAGSAAGDPRMRMNGRDFVELMAWFLDKADIKRGMKSQALADLLRVSIEPGHLTVLPMFTRLVRRLDR